ncbi:MAG: dephospho-CoA kinase [Thermodesulfobacteriota bacterium]
MGENSLPLVAITGNAGSGKTRVCRYLRDLGESVIELDTLAREAVIPGRPAYLKILQVFGKDMAGSSGDLDRRKVRNMVIRDDSARKRLEQIIHPEITRLMMTEIKKAADSGKELVFIEVPLLFETGLEKKFDVVLLVVSDPQIRIDRLVRRDAITSEEAALLIKTQLPDEMKKTASHFIIQNMGSEEDLLKETGRVYRELRNYLKKNRKSLTGNITSYKDQPEQGSKPAC